MPSSSIPPVSPTSSSDDALLRRVAATDAPPLALAVPSVAGRYEVRGRIGRGGLGVVHVGWDPRLQREVALKFVRPDQLRGRGDEQRIDRLRREARILARLDHPAIVPVFDIGEASGQLYIAMELLRGPTLRTWAKTETSWRRVLAACLEAARGLAAAHGRGVVHRDFKPDNVVVADGVRVVVVDFGLADETTEPSARSSAGSGAGDDTSRAGEVAGTRGYLAPELLAGAPATPASDQYAWCVTCRELLEQRSPRTPDRVGRALRRGCSADPATRFATMQELVDAIASAASPMRRRLGIAVGGAATAAVAWLGAGALVEHRRHVACEDEGRTIAEVWNDDTRQAIRTGVLATEVPYAEGTIQRVLPWLERRADAWRVKRTEACELVVRGDWDRAMLDRSTWCFEERRNELQSIVETLERADTRVASNAISLAIATDLPPPSLCADADVLMRLPDPPGEAGRSELRELAADLASSYALDLAGHSQDAIDVAAPVPERAAAAGWLPLELTARLRLGTAFIHAKRKEEARRELEAAYFGAEQIGWWTVAGVAALRVINTFEPDQIDRALQWSRSAEAAFAQVPDEARAFEPELHTAVAIAYVLHRERDNAYVAFREAFAAAERELGSDHPTTIKAALNLGAALNERGDSDEARALLASALASAEQSFGPEHPLTAGALNNLAVTLMRAGDYAGALPLHERALAIREAIGPQDPELATSLNNLANTHSNLGHPEQARPLLTRAIALQEPKLGPDHPAVATMVHNLGNIDLRLHDWEQAKIHYERALASREQALGPDNLETAASLNAVGLAEEGLGRTDAAEQRFREAILAFEHAGAKETIQFTEPLLGLARIELARGRAREAVTLTQRAVEVLRQDDIEPARLASAEAALARASWEAGDDRAAAVALAETAAEVLAAASPVWAPERAEVEAWLAAHR